MKNSFVRAVAQKKETYRLTSKQVEAIQTALFEWGSLEREHTEGGQKIGKYCHSVLRSIEKQIRDRCEGDK